MQFSPKTTLAEVKALQHSSEELAKVISIVIPDIASYPTGATIDDLGPRNAYNAAISLDLILREHLAQRKILYEMTCCSDSSDAHRTVLFCFAPNRNAPWVLVLPAAEQDTVPAAKSSGIPIAFEMVKFAVNVAVLRYSPNNCVDEIDRAVDLLRELAPEQEIILAGFANGGLEALRWAAVPEHHAAAVISASAPAAEAAGCIHPGFPPTYIIHGMLDDVVPVEHASVLDRALADHGVRRKLWLVPDAKNNFGKGFNTLADGWLEDAARFCLDSIGG